MRNARTVVSVLSVMLAMRLVPSLTGSMAIAQSVRHEIAAQQDPAQPSGDTNTAAKQKTFTGKIVKSGDKLVLSETQSKVTYQLDDQQKAQEYVNQSVKVTGILDAATGTIRVSAIDPA